VTTLGVITARGGSKGIPGKNLKPLAGKPLLAYTVDAAQAARLDRVILSTDDETIAACGRSLGCDVPFLRPAELAHDETPHLPVMQHAVRWLAEHQQFHPDVVVILQPTSPLRRPGDIRQAVELLATHDIDSVVSVSAVPAHLNPMRMLRVDERGRAVLFVSGAPVRHRINRRQDMPEAWVMNGAIYAFRSHVLFAAEASLYGSSTLAMPLPAPYGISIDDLHDWREAEHALGNHHGS
jgi:CMP-N-acetylneuraminic acid synthetase